MRGICERATFWTAMAVAAAVSFAWPRLTLATVVRVGSEFQVSSDSTRAAYFLDIDTAADGSFVVVWNARGGENNGRTVFGRCFDAGGSAEGDDTRISEVRNDLGVASNPAVAVESNGAFAVTWFWADREILVRRYDSTGAPTEAEFVVQTDTQGDHLFPDVATSQQGDLVAVWESNVGGNRASEVSGRSLPVTGPPGDPQFPVSGTFPEADHFPSIAMRSDGSFVVAWKNIERDPQMASRIVARVYASDGQPVGDAFVVDEQAIGKLSVCAVGMAEDGRFVVAWPRFESQSDPGRVLARQFEADGTALGGEFVVGIETTALVGYPDVAMLPGGGFVVVWGQFNSVDFDVSARAFHSDGTPMGERFLVGLGGSEPAVAADPSGGFVVAWAGPGGRAQRFTVNPMCGDADGNRTFTAQDALLILRGSVGLSGCEACICNTSGGGMVTATDALMALQRAVGAEIEFNCPTCD
jgi:hypothetical protein